MAPLPSSMESTFSDVGAWWRTRILPLATRGTVSSYVSAMTPWLPTTSALTITATGCRSRESKEVSRMLLWHLGMSAFATQSMDLQQRESRGRCTESTCQPTTSASDSPGTRDQLELSHN